MRKKKEVNIQIGNQIKKARESNGLTQEEFAELIDRTPQFISDLERGVSGISIETLKIICEKLCVSSDSILFAENRLYDDGIRELSDKFRRMTDSQFYVMEEITNAFLRASNTVERNNG